MCETKMNWYKIASNFNQKILMHPDFIGFHCQKRARSKYDDIIINDENYAENYYTRILEALPNNLRDQAKNENLLRYEQPDKYSEEFDEWKNNTYQFLKDHNIRWLFVSGKKPLTEQYGTYCYYVMLPKSSIMEIFDDPWVNDIAWAYVYDGNTTSPTCIEIQENEY